MLTLVLCSQLPVPVVSFVVFVERQQLLAFWLLLLVCVPPQLAFWPEPVLRALLRPLLAQKRVR